MIMLCRHVYFHRGYGAEGKLTSFGGEGRGECLDVCENEIISRIPETENENDRRHKELT
jgi:hypothetical protein